MGKIEFHPTTKKRKLAEEQDKKSELKPVDSISGSKDVEVEGVPDKKSEQVPRDAVSGKTLEGEPNKKSEQKSGEMVSVNTLPNELSLYEASNINVINLPADLDNIDLSSTNKLKYI